MPNGEKEYPKFPSSDWWSRTWGELERGLSPEAWSQWWGNVKANQWTTPQPSVGIWPTMKGPSQQPSAPDWYKQMGREYGERGELRRVLTDQLFRLASKEEGLDLPFWVMKDIETWDIKRLQDTVTYYGNLLEGRGKPSGFQQPWQETPYWTPGGFGALTGMSPTDITRTTGFPGANTPSWALDPRYWQTNEPYPVNPQTGEPYTTRELGFSGGGDIGEFGLTQPAEYMKKQKIGTTISLIDFRDLISSAPEELKDIATKLNLALSKAISQKGQTKGFPGISTEQAVIGGVVSANQADVDKLMQGVSVARYKEYPDLWPVYLEFRAAGGLQPFHTWLQVTPEAQALLRLREEEELKEAEMVTARQRPPRWAIPEQRI